MAGSGGSVTLSSQSQQPGSSLPLWKLAVRWSVPEHPTASPQRLCRLPELSMETGAICQLPSFLWESPAKYTRMAQNTKAVSSLPTPSPTLELIQLTWRIYKNRLLVSTPEVLAQWSWGRAWECSSSQAPRWRWLRAPDRPLSRTADISSAWKGEQCTFSFFLWTSRGQQKGEDLS